MNSLHLTRGKDNKLLMDMSDADLSPYAEIVFTVKNKRAENEPVVYSRSFEPESGSLTFTVAAEELEPMTDTCYADVDGLTSTGRREALSDVYTVYVNWKVGDMHDRAN